MAAALALLAGAAFADPGLAIVVSDETPLRAAPRDSSKPHAMLWQGETLEVRGERMDYVQVYDHRLERGGFVSARHVRRLPLDPAGAPDLLAIVRFLRETPGSEALGIGYSAAYVRAAPASSLRGAEGAEAFDAIGAFAERLARRASIVTSKPAQAALFGHLEVAQQYGVVFKTYERDPRMVMCYDGDAFRHVIASAASTATQRARAALALTRPDCAPSALEPTARRAADEASAELLDHVAVDGLLPHLRNRLHMRRVVVWGGLAFQRARHGESGATAAARALQELASVDKQQLTDEDARNYVDAAMRVNASRWAAVTTSPASNGRPRLVTVAGSSGETCVLLVDAKRDATNPLARRCTYGIAWESSASLNREGNALAIAVQHTDAWRELWLFRKAGADWRVQVVPPAAIAPGVGYAEFAGWVPGGKQVLVAREAAGEGKYRRTFELLRVDTLATIAQASDPGLLPAFQRWQDPAWKQATVSLR